jgi:DivIVA domain-containing protein
MPEDRRMTISSSSPLTPDDVARHTFASVRRGFDPGEVRDYLESIAAALRATSELEQELREQVADAEHRAANPVIDQVTLTEAVGKETARVLISANEAAAEKVANAESEASRMVAEATERSERMLAEAQETSDQAQAKADALLAERTAQAEAAAAELRQRTDAQVAEALEAARADASAQVERARDEGRTMVEEAQQLRTRVLADLGRRRKVLHVQLEQMRAGRDRMAEALADVRRSMDDIADDLAAAEDSARVAAEVAGRDASLRTDEELSDEEIVALSEETPTTGHDSVVPDRSDEPEPAQSDMAQSDMAQSDMAEPDAARSEPAQPDAAQSQPAAVEADMVEEGADPSEDGSTGSEVDALFAKLRAAQEPDAGEVDGVTVVPDPSDQGATEAEPTGTKASKPAKAAKRAKSAQAEAAAAGTAVAVAGAEAAGPAPEPAEAEPEGPPDGRDPRAIGRDDAIGPIVTGLARRLKRNLQDEQNDLLDRLRGKGVTWSTDLLPDEVEHVDGVATSALPFLEDAAEAGALFAAGSKKRPTTDDLLGVARELAESVVGPLRKRLGASDGVDPADEPAVHEHVGSAFREWKGERVEGMAADAVVEAFSMGTVAAADPDGPGLVWVAVAHVGETPCPDCEDNGLADPQAPGADFATGHAHPPAHPGCRCVLALPAT